MIAMVSWRSIIEEVRRERIRGAAWCARRIAEAFIALASDPSYSPQLLDEAAGLALQANPSMTSIYNVVYLARQAKSREMLVEYMNRFIEYLGWARNRILESSRDSVAGAVITISYSSTVRDLIIAAGNSISKVYVLESSPGREGIILAKELKEHGLDVEVLPDSSFNYYLEKTDIVLVGADSVGKNACIINKIGTMPLAYFAHYYGLEVYPVFEAYKIHPEKTCYEIPLLEREYEVDGFKTRTPLFDRTPGKYLTAMITEHGLLKPSRIEVRRAYQQFIDWVIR